MTFTEAFRRAEDDQVEEVCRSLRLDDDRGSEVLAWHRDQPSLVALVHLHGGGAREFVLGHLECEGLIPVRTSG